jgi:hypothetical protein
MVLDVSEHLIDEVFPADISHYLHDHLTYTVTSVYRSSVWEVWTTPGAKQEADAFASTLLQASK